MLEVHWRMKKRLYMIAVVVLVTGLLASLFIYMTAGSEPGDVLGYDVVGGQLHPISPDESKTYRHDLEVYGGKANIVMDKFIRWFEGLWHGKSLAFTMAAITAIISFGFFLSAYYWPPYVEGDGEKTD